MGSRLFPPPTLGVSSLDLGRRLADGPFFILINHFGLLRNKLAVDLLRCGAVWPQLLQRDGG